jgi:flavin reductase (DIM6/NTAB) family NADH-FMN oxidoreductase RutF
MASFLLALAVPCSPVRQCLTIAGSTFGGFTIAKSQVEERAFYRFVNPVGIVTACHDGRCNAMSAEWTSLISLKPYLLGVYVAQERYTHSLIEQEEVFSVSLLRNDQAALAVLFGNSTAWEVDKTPLLEQYTEPSPLGGGPLVKGANAHFVCKIADRHTVGSHTLLVGVPLYAKPVAEDQPLAYHGGRYFRLGEQLRRPRTE